MDDFDLLFTLWERLCSGVTVEEVAYDDGIRSNPTSWVLLASLLTASEYSVSLTIRNFGCLIQDCLQDR